MKKSVSLPFDLGYAEDEEVMIEPLPDHSPDEIVKLYERSGLPPPAQLAPRFFSGKAPAEVRDALQSIAIVHRKPVKKLH